MPRSTLAILALLSAACGGPSRPDILLVTIDTLRADHLGCYGYPRDTSSFLDSLAARGVIFDRAFSSSATTVPAHASLFTGLYPLQHGLRQNGGSELPAEVPTLAERLGRAGYETAAFVSVRSFLAAAGLHRGFQHFDTPETASEDRALRTVDRALRWLERPETSRPLFLWLHLWDPHSPYAPAEPFRDGADAAAYLELLESRHRLSRRFFDDSDEHILALMNAYDGEILAVDGALRSFFEKWGRLRDAEMISIVTADHGEGLGNHDWLLHGKNIYNEQLRVPLIVNSTADRFTPRRVGAVVEQVDLPATLLELVRVEPGTDHRGHSLVPLLEGREGSRRGWAFSERRAFSSRPPGHPPRALGADRFVSQALLRAMRENFEPGEKYSLQDERFKYILNTELGAELYDLARDPYETHNLIGRGLPAEPLMRSRLEALLADLTTAGAAPLPPAPDADLLEELRALGYLR